MRDTLVMHLSMSGRFEIAAAAEAPTRPGQFATPPIPTRSTPMWSSTPKAARRVTYYDPRRFGYVDLIQTDRP